MWHWALQTDKLTHCSQDDIRDMSTMLISTHTLIRSVPLIQPKAPVYCTATTPSVTSHLTLWSVKRSKAITLRSLEGEGEGKDEGLTSECVVVWVEACPIGPHLNSGWVFPGCLRPEKHETSHRHNTIKNNESDHWSSSVRIIYGCQNKYLWFWSVLKYKPCEAVWVERTVHSSDLLSATPNWSHKSS